MEPGILPGRTGGWEPHLQLCPVGRRKSRMRIFSTAGCTMVTSRVTSCEGPHPACGQSQPGGLDPHRCGCEGSWTPWWRAWRDGCLALGC